MKLVVCETVAAIAKHLREDDGTRKMSGGLDCPSVMFCKPRQGTMGWDTQIPPPKSLEEAHEQTKNGRVGVDNYCPACLAEWERRLKAG